MDMVNRQSNDVTAEEGDDEEEPSSSSDKSANVEDALTSFREKWRKELTTPNNQPLLAIAKYDSPQESDIEDKAKALFLKGCEMERNGDVYDAILYYRRAVQLVPDIEFRIDEKTRSKTTNRECCEPEESATVTDEMSYQSDDSDSSFEEFYDGKLLPHIQRKVGKMSNIFIPQIVSKTTHISDLPIEIILYILRWVVSSDLDLRSLEKCSETCRGFYLCCRDPEIWRLACARAWGLNCGNAPHDYSSWREMYIKRHRVLYGGCYISKTTYIRNGENSFQDQFYRPWHLVTYYRYLRFFPEGLVLMMTTPDEPAHCVGKLKHRVALNPAILSGHYRMKDDTVLIVLQHLRVCKHGSIFKKNRRNAFDDDPVKEQIFDLEMKIRNSKKRSHARLVWSRYSIHTVYKNGSKNCTTFDLTGTLFPPLWFSLVKSYSSDSIQPL